MDDLRYALGKVEAIDLDKSYDDVSRSCRLSADTSGTALDEGSPRIHSA